MQRRGRATSAVTLAVVWALALAACTTSTTTDEVPPPPGSVATKTSSPDASLTVISDTDDVESALHTSRELFDASPVVIIAPIENPQTQALAAHAAVMLGIPLLIGPSATSTIPRNAMDSITPELNRLGASHVIVVGEVVHLLGEPDRTKPSGTPSATPSRAPSAKAGSTPAIPSTDASRIIIRVDATPAALEAAIGLPIDAPRSTDPTGYAAEVAALTPGTRPEPTAGPSTGPSAGLTASPTARPTTSPATGSPASGPPVGTPSARALPPITRDRPLEDTIALAVDAPEQLGSIATARAAGVPVHLVPATTPNPQATASVIEALHESKADKTLVIGAGFAAETALDWKIRAAKSGVQLPGGGQLLFPQHQFVALYGMPGSGALGVLGEQGLDAAVQRARDTAAPYQALTDRTVVPMFEIIATAASAFPGKDGNYSAETAIETLRPWVDGAAAAGLYVVLDLQPGRTDFLTQAKLYQPLLELPNVGLALDPEWRLLPGQVHLRQIGSVGIEEVNGVANWLADLTNEKGLPQKMFVLHQFQLRMIQNRAALTTSRPELAMLIHADGQGSQPAKQETWRVLHQGAPAGVAWGWKNFYDEDLPVLTPEQTMSTVSPHPDLITYQ